MIKLQCHCGQVEAEINVPEKLEKIIRCNCSFCKRRGAVMSLVKNENFKVTKGREKLKSYNFTLMLLNTTFVITVVYIHITILDQILL